MFAKLRASCPWLAVGLVMLVIFGLSAQPHSAEFTARFFGPYNHAVRKLAHFTEYAVLFTVLAVALRRAYSRLSAASIAVISLAVSVVFAASDEFHQIFVAGRTPALSDVWLDSCGALLAASIWLSWHARTKWWRR